MKVGKIIRKTPVNPSIRELQEISKQINSISQNKAGV